jgi:putative nucleotidyltransferase with HDIG domain
MKEVTYKELRESEEIKAYIEQGNAVLGALGFTEHSEKHAVKTAETAGKILKELGYPKRTAELARIAGYLHDMGNCVNRNDHAHSGALMAFRILREMGMDPKEIAVVVSAIGEHDEHTGTAVDAVSAALILADKTDVRRNRVRNKIKANFDKHDRVNYAAKSSKLTIQTDKKVITLNIELDESMCSMMDYFEIFLQRMLMCRRAAELLGMRFKLTANGSKIV